MIFRIRTKKYAADQEKWLRTKSIFTPKTPEPEPTALELRSFKGTIGGKFVY